MKATAVPTAAGRIHDFSTLGANYVYLLGLYLGDGTIASHPRGVYKLRLVLDVKYQGIIEECCSAMGSVVPDNSVNRALKPSNCVEVYAYSKTWPCLFPQHGPGPKHKRRIWLADWQQTLAERWPGALLRGLFQSDGHRFINTGRGGWTHPRYGFSNLSTDLTSTFCTPATSSRSTGPRPFPRTSARR